MADPISTGLAVGGGILSGASSVGGALSQNSAARRAMGDARDQARTQMSQAANSAGLEMAKNNRRRAQIEGMIRVADNPGSAAGMLARQAAVDAAFNNQITRTNYSNQVTNIRLGYEASAQQLANQTINPLVAALTGIIGGVSTGLSLGGSIDRATYTTEQADLAEMRLRAMREGGMPY